MVKLDIKALVENVLAGAQDLANRLFKGYVAEAVEDSNSFLHATEDKLKLWSLALTNGTLTKDEFASLVAGQQDLLKIKALKQAGIAQVKLTEFKKGVIELLTTSVFQFIGI